MEGNDDDLRLAYLKQWWLETANPLYVWETIGLSLARDPPLPIPDWCLPCLAEASANITSLATEYGNALRKIDKKDASEKAKSEWNKVKNRLPSALKFAQERKKNAFSRMRDDAYAGHASLDQKFGLQQGTITTIKLDGAVLDRSTAEAIPTIKRVMKERSVEAERARRIIASGHKLTRQG